MYIRTTLYYMHVHQQATLWKVMESNPSQTVVRLYLPILIFLHFLPLGRLNLNSKIIFYYVKIHP